MTNRRMTMTTYAIIISRLQNGDSVRAIAKTKIAGRHTIAHVKKVVLEKGWLNEKAIIPSEKELLTIFEKKPKGQQGLKVNKHLEKITAWAKEGFTARIIYKRLKEHFYYDGSYDSVRRAVHKVKDENYEKNLTVPLHFLPGEAAQVDFGYGPKIYDERTKRLEKTYFFVMTLCYSRHQFAMFVTNQDIEQWLLCHQRAFEFFNGVPRKLIIDNPKCAITTAGYYDADMNRSYEYFAAAWNVQISPCPPRDPQKKGRVESGVQYIKRSFLPLRDFKNLNDANAQLIDWILNEAGTRIHGSTYLKPLDLFNESENLNPLPQTMPEIAVWRKTKGGRNCHIIHKYCHYSFPYQYYKRDLWVKQTPSSVVIYCDGEVIACHPRIFIKGEYSTKTDHLPSRCSQFLKRTSKWCIAEAERIGPSTSHVINFLLNDKKQDFLRSAQGVIKLSERYDTERLEKACERAIAFNSIRYKTIKHILEKDIDEQDVTREVQQIILSKVYKGEAVYQRSSTSTYQLEVLTETTKRRRKSKNEMIKP